MCKKPHRSSSSSVILSAQGTLCMLPWLHHNMKENISSTTLDGPNVPSSSNFYQWSYNPFLSWSQPTQSHCSKLWRQQSLVIVEGQQTHRAVRLGERLEQIIITRVWTAARTSSPMTWEASTFNSFCLYVIQTHQNRSVCVNPKSTTVISKASFLGLPHTTFVVG